MKIIQKITNKESIDPVYAEPRLGDIKHSYAKITKAQRSLEFEPKVQLEKGLEQLIKWHSKQ